MASRQKTRYLVLQLARPPSTPRRLEPLLLPSSNAGEAAIDLSRRASKNEVADRVPRNLDAAECAQDMDLLVREDDSRLADVLNREPRLAVLACDAADGAAEMVPRERLDVLDLERFDVQLLHAKDRDGVFGAEPE